MTVEPSRVEKQGMENDDGWLVRLETANVAKPRVRPVPDGGVVICGEEVNIGHDSHWQRGDEEKGDSLRTRSR
jgi:hypothetical protein